MCVVSNIGDYWSRRVPEDYPWVIPRIDPLPTGPNPFNMNPVSREEFDKLKRDVEELKKLLIAGKEFDEKTGQPHCEHEDKIALIKKIAELVGVDMKDVF